MDHNSAVGVMYYPFVEEILACFPNAALLYHVNTVRLNQFNGSNRYKLQDNICIVGALNLILLSILVYLVQTFDLVLCWWPNIGIASRRLNMGWWPDTKDHILCNVYMKNVKLRTLSLHQYYCQNNLASGTYCLIFDWSHWLSFHCQITSFQILHVAWQAL